MSIETGRRGVLSALACGVAMPLLAACGSRSPAPRILDLGPAPVWNPPLRLPRRVDVQWVSGSELMQSTTVVYRLDYVDPYTRRAYRDSRWAAPVPTLVAGRLRQLASRAELAGDADMAPPASLMVELEDCVQRFSSASQSEVTLRLSATLATPVSGSTGMGAGLGAGPAASERKASGAAQAPHITRKTFEGNAPAGGDADGAVRALAQVLDRIGAEMLVWAATNGSSSARA